jgi:hypothetical protein
VHHSAAGGDGPEPERIRQFFRGIDAAVCDLLQAAQTPLIIAGPDELLAPYREISRYPHLMSSGIPGNADLLPIHLLHERAWEVVSPHFATATVRARERYAALRGTAFASDDLATVLGVVHRAGVLDLFVAADSERWGTYDVLSDQVYEHQPRHPSDDDLLNLALVQAIASGAHVEVLPQMQMPDHGHIAAVFHG